MFCVGQAQQQLEAQQAQHAIDLQDLSSKAEEMESRLQQAADLDQQHVTQLTACEADLEELRQVGSATAHYSFTTSWCKVTIMLQSIRIPGF